MVPFSPFQYVIGQVVMRYMHKLVATSLASIVLTISQSVFALDLNDNAKEVANKLNQLLQRTEPCDNNEPAFYCSGVIIHGQEFPVKDDNNNLLPSWYLPSYRTVGSFSYLRADITPHSGEPIWVNTGYILTPIDDLEKNKQFHYKVYCEYPADGSTYYDLETSCHFSTKNSSGATITSKDIKTADDYVSQFLVHPQEDDWRLYSIPLAFQPNKNDFDMAMELHKYIYKDHINKISKDVCNQDICRDHNELIISAWDKNIVAAAQVPIMAFFAIINDDQNPFFKGTGRISTSDDEMEQLFKDADAYAKATNYTRRIPVITIDMGKLRNGDKNVFSPAVRPVVMDR